MKISHFLGTSENAVRIQIAVALIAFVLLRLAHDADRIVASPLAFARLIRANLMHRRSIGDLLRPPPPPEPEPQPTLFEFAALTSRLAPPRRTSRARVAMAHAA